MKIIRLCMERRRRQHDRSEAPLCSDWVQETPDAREELNRKCANGNAQWGTGTHWIEERVAEKGLAKVRNMLRNMGARALVRQGSRVP